MQTTKIKIHLFTSLGKLQNYLLSVPVALRTADFEAGVTKAENQLKINGMVGVGWSRKAGIMRVLLTKI